MRGILAVAVTCLMITVHAAAGADDVIPLLDFVGETVINISFDGLDLPECEGIRNLYRTGLYDRISVTGRSVEEGVEIRFHLTPKRWIKEVRFKGNLRLSNRSLSRRLDLSREEELTAVRLEENRQKIIDYYEHRGFRETQISYMTEVGPDQKTDVIFGISEGPRSRITQVRLTGDSGWSNFKLSSIIASMPGEMLDGRTLDRDVEKIVKKLK
jgi:outer membrane protein assembly factor BamA